MTHYYLSYKLIQYRLMKKLTVNSKVWVGVMMALVTTLGLMATDIYAPAMPVVMQVMKTTSDSVQLTVTLFLIAAGVSQLIYGPLSDQWGRRPIMLTGLGIYMLGTLLCTFAPNMAILLTGRFVQGMGTGAIMSLNRVIIRDTFAGLQLVKAMSYIGAFVALAPAVAPALGGFIEFRWGWRWIFGFLLIYSLVMGALAWRMLPETHVNRLNQPLSLSRVFSNYIFITQNRRFWANVCCAGLAFSSMIICATINPFLIENNLGKTVAEYGLWAMISSAGFLAGMIMNTPIVQRVGTTRTLQIGNGVILAMGLIFIICGYLKVMSVGLIILPTIGVTFGIALVFPNAFVGAITPFSMIAGAAGALYGCVQVGISFITSIAVALLNESSQLPMGILLLCTGGLGLLIYGLLKDPSWENVGSPSLGAD
jgi:Bcr/CflA subfamily drug resistance transporter